MEWLYFGSIPCSLLLRSMIHLKTFSSLSDRQPMRNTFKIFCSFEFPYFQNFFFQILQYYNINNFNNHINNRPTMENR